MFEFRENNYNIIVSSDEYSLKLYKDNELYITYTVGLGKDSTPTPKGVFTIINKLKNPGKQFGKRWLGLDIPTYGIHGTYDLDSIGKNLSKGCIRLKNEDIIELFDLVPIGTTVEII